MAAIYFVWHQGLVPKVTVPTFTPGAPSSGNFNSGNTNAPAAGVITLETSGTYHDLIADLAQKWEQSNPGDQINILPSKESRDTMQTVLAAYKSEDWNDIPNLWLCSTKPLVDSLQDHTSTRSLGDVTMVNNSDSGSYFEWPPQPMVILAKQNRSSDLDSLTSSDNPLTTLTPGRFKFSFADPITSSGGHSALGYCYWSFLQQHKYRSFSQYLLRLQADGYEPSTDGSGVLADDFRTSDLDFIFIHGVLADKEMQASGGDSLSKKYLKSTVYESPVLVALHTRATSDAHQDAEMESFIRFVRANLNVSNAPAGGSIGLPSSLDDQKIIWEKLFNEGRRTSNVHGN